MDLPSSFSRQLCPGRLVSLASAAVLTGALLVSTAPAANAAWRTQHAFHGAKVQMCKVHVEGQRFELRVRVDNRDGKHAHTGAIFRTRNGTTATAMARAGAGGVSGYKALMVRSGDKLQSGAGEGEGIGMGDLLRLSDTPRC